MSRPLKIFITYSHKNLREKNRLITFLDVMRQEGIIDIWHDNEILAGDMWREEIFSTHLPNSDLLLYLVSADSLASETCNRELGLALEKDIRPIPIILEECDWKNHKLRSPHALSSEGFHINERKPHILSDIQALPVGGKPLNEWKPKSKGWQSIVEGIRKTIDKMQSQLNLSSKTSEDELLAELAFQRGGFLILLNSMELAIESLSKAIELNSHHVLAYSFRGTAYFMEDSFDLAINDYNKAIELDPDGIEIYNERGICHYNKGDLDLAIADFNMVIELKPDFTSAYNGRGLAYTDKGDYDLAIADFNMAIELNSYDTNKDQVNQTTTNSNITPELNPNFAKALYTECYYTFLYNRGRAYAIKGEVDVAIDDFSMAIKLNPEFTEAYYNLGVAHWDKGEVDVAIDDFSMAIKLNPDYAKAYNNRGVAYNIKGDYNLAIDDFSMAIKLNPDYAEAHYNRGNLHRSKSNFTKAIIDYNKAIELNPDYAEAYNNRGVTYRFMEDLNSAITDYSKAIKINSKYPEAYYNRGNAYHSKGEHDKAINDCSKAIELDPKEAKAYFNRGIAYDSKDETDLAINDYSMAIKLKPDYAQVYSYRGVGHWIRGEDNLSIQDFSTAIELNSEDSESYCYRGILRLLFQNWQEAKADLTIAKNLGMDISALFTIVCSGVANFEQKFGVQLPEDIAALLTSPAEPNDAEIYNIRGIAYGESGDYDEAIEAFTKTMELKPEYADAYASRGNAYRDKGEMDKAIADYTKSIVLKPKVAESYYTRGEAWLRIRKWEEAQQDLTAAILQGVDIAEVFHNTHDSIAAFEEETGVKLPEDIVNLLTPRQEPLEIDKETRIALAMKYYENEELSSGLAAHLAGVSREDFWYLMADYGLSLFGTAEDLQEELENAHKASHQ